MVDLLNTSEGHEALQRQVTGIFEVLMASGSVSPADGHAVGGDASPLAVGNADGGDAQTWKEHIQEVLLSSVSIGGQGDDGTVDSACKQYGFRRCLCDEDRGPL